MNTSTMIKTRIITLYIFAIFLIANTVSVGFAAELNLNDPSGNPATNINEGLTPEVSTNKTYSVSKAPADELLKLRGVIINTAGVTSNDGTPFSDTLENRLILEKNRGDWRFYGDGRLYLNFARAEELNDKYDLKIMRSFIRYNRGSNSYTAGKTYINLGIPGLYNPFDINKTVAFTDLSYDKEGLLSMDIAYTLGDLAELEMFASYFDDYNSYITGMELAGNFSAFDISTIILRTGMDRKYREKSNVQKGRTKGGIAVKGDAVIGINGSLSYCVYDGLTKKYAEANTGTDYSFFDGRLFSEALIYYNGQGADSENKYVPLQDAYTLGKFAAYLGSTYTFDEFLSGGFSMFQSITDYSILYIPSAAITINNGLEATAYLMFSNGSGMQEYSKKVFGKYAGGIKLEANF